MQHDPPFKELLQAFFADFLRLFFPAQARRLRLGEAEFLDKEVFTDVVRGRERRLDLVARVETRAGEPELVLVHVEVESRSRREFPARMHEYYMALRLRHRCPVFPIERVLTRAAGGLDRPSHREEVLGEEVDVFRYWRVGLPRLPGGDYLASPNRLAPALAALMRPGTPTRAEWKARCLDGLRKVRVDEARRRLLANCVETYLTLSAREEKEFEGLLGQESRKELRKMRKSWIEQCEERGEKRGEARGELRAKRETLQSQMRAKFGPLPAGVAKAVSAIASRRRLDTLLRRVLTARTLADMGLAK